MTVEISINNRPIGRGQPCYVIAEAGVNHNGSLDVAHQLIRAARQAGADCVKFQTFRADRLLSGEAPKANYQLRTTNPDESQNAMLKKLEMPESWHFELASACLQQGIDFLSTPYSFEDVDFLDSMGVAAFKLASIHCAEPAFVQYVASKQRPLILATGMANLGEVDAAVRAAREAGNEQLVLLQCTTDYPSRPQDANLRAMKTMNRTFGLPVGYSDHTETPTACIASIALEACIIEKHFTLDRSMPGPDHAASFDPEQFGLLVKVIRETESVLGSGIKEPCAAEMKNMKAMRRSLAARRDLVAGEVLDLSAVALMRPGSGLKPALLSDLLGLRLCRPVKAGQLLSFEDFGDDR